jgi:hypothetical protein
MNHHKHQVQDLTGDMAPDGKILHGDGVVPVDAGLRMLSGSKEGA